MEEDAKISSFRRGNKIIAVGFTLSIISAALLILTLGSAVVNAPSPEIIAVDDFRLPVESFCSHSNTPRCISALNSIITDRFAIEPHQIVALCIQTAAKYLQNLIAASSNLTRKFDSSDCSDSLRIGSDRVRQSLAAMNREKRRFLDRGSVEVVIRWLTAATEEVDYCLGVLWEVESPEIVAPMKAKVDYVLVYLDSAYGFLRKSRMQSGDNAEEEDLF